MKNVGEIQKVREAFNSILRADYISVSDVNQLSELNDYYVDFLKNLPKVLQSQDSYINGRRGTGKTTLLMRAYYECLKTISPTVEEKSVILGKKKILPIYIDLSQCKDVFCDGEAETFERSFILHLIDEFRKQLDTIFSESKFKIFKNNYSELESFEDALNLIIEGMTVKKIHSSEKERIQTDEESTIGGKLSISDGSINARISEGVHLEIERDNQFTNCCTTQKLLGCLGEIRQKSSLNAIYVFIDEFSDLTIEEQQRFSILLKKLLGSKNNIFFKVGTITDRFYFGQNIIVGRDIYPISLDLSDFVEKYGGIVQAMKELEKYTEELIKKRLEIYADNITLSEIIKGNKGEIISRISKEALGVPRTIGMILQHALAQAEIKKDVFIQLNEINVGIRETRKIYFRQFQGAIAKKVIPGFYMDMWNSIIKKALDEKKKNPDRPASHFMIDPIRKKYLNVFCENFIIHCLEDSRASKYGGNYVLFSIDFDICNDNNIAYATEKDEFTAVRFIYDSVLQCYDGYFLKEKIKSYKCPVCNAIYEDTDVARMKVKRCFECDEKLEEIVHQEVPITEGNYTEVEVKILGLIATLTIEDAMTASEIAEAVGCTYQKVALWGSRVLAKKGLINIEKRGGKTVYFDNGEADEN